MWSASEIIISSKSGDKFELRPKSKCVHVAKILPGSKETGLTFFQILNCVSPLWDSGLEPVNYRNYNFCSLCHILDVAQHVHQKRSKPLSNVQFLFNGFHWSLYAKLRCNLEKVQHENIELDTKVPVWSDLEKEKSICYRASSVILTLKKNCRRRERGSDKNENNRSRLYAPTYKWHKYWIHRTFRRWLWWYELLTIWSIYLFSAEENIWCKSLM